MSRSRQVLRPALLLATMILSVSPVTLPLAAATKGSYPGVNGKIVFEAVPGGEQDSEIYVMNPDGSEITRLTSNGVWDSDPCWSPDGSKIVYSSGDAIWVMNFDGSNPKKLTTPSEDNYDVDPAWSPDGNKIAFIRNYVGGQLSSIICT